MNFDHTQVIDQEVLEIKKSLISADYYIQEEKDFIADKIIVKKVKKGELILREGQFIKNSYHLFKGCIREYYLKDGEEKTVGFYTAGDSLSSDETKARQVPSTVSWECVCECIISIYPFEVETELYKRFPRLESMCRLETTKQYFNYKTEVNNYLSFNPGERYENLMKTKPEVFQLVPLYHIASYIGVKPESLSRIRNRLSTSSSLK